MTLKLAMVTIDSLNPGPLASWWAEQTGGTIAEDNDGWYYVLKLPGGVSLAIQKVDDPTPGKNRVHLDLVTDTLAEEKARLLAAGATLVADHEMSGFAWVTLADPDGNQFCVASGH